MSEFRTRTGQTGTDAYAYELAQIRNARRELDARMAHLVQAISDELPADITPLHSIATERFPDARMTGDRDSLRKQLAMNTLADDFSTSFVGDVIRAIADPDYVIGF